MGKTIHYHPVNLATGRMYFGRKTHKKLKKTEITEKHVETKIIPCHGNVPYKDDDLSLGEEDVRRILNLPSSQVQDQVKEEDCQKTDKSLSSSLIGARQKLTQGNEIIAPVDEDFSEFPDSWTNNEYPKLPEPLLEPKGKKVEPD